MAKVITILKQSLQEAERDIERLEAELIRLRAVRDGLGYAIEREQRPRTKPQVNGGLGDWGGPRIAAVERVLREAATPLSPIEIARQLQDRGRDDSTPGVSAALSRLKRESRAVQSGYGKWSAAAPEHEERLDADVQPLHQAAEGGG